MNRAMVDTIWASEGPRIKAVAGLAGGAFGSLAGGALRFTFGAAARQSSRLPPVLFHYSDEAAAPLINSSGQIGAPGASQFFFTNTGNLSPAQARELLALPSTNSARSLFAVDSQVLSRSSLLRSGVVPASRDYNRLGGGLEFVFRQPARGGFTQMR